MSFDLNYNYICSSLYLFNHQLMSIHSEGYMLLYTCLKYIIFYNKTINISSQY